ncbi:hypothetical protein HHJ74_05500 [Mobiluncus mulieris]|uniref:Uncharacterized protein n=1 Tax=Mobiluncus mulieris TaxID=2052 RepID=A0A848RGY4_9ACTO|nr:hypothetical protein [Mobiluncus mulieris]MCV0013147.1 hypothetical protein [Mobiluncus mulieris]NMW62780.1 hypothetical protein [Mobiluncus mulieris]NMW80998.1 hypothetical protein [Mobiluncus mulieris]NMW93150.1 hypothetical protein [Mobiluncus mulieris]
MFWGRAKKNSLCYLKRSFAPGFSSGDIGSFAVIRINPMRFLFADLVKGCAGGAETYDDPGLGW